MFMIENMTIYKPKYKYYKYVYLKKSLSILKYMPTINIQLLITTNTIINTIK